MAYSTIYVRRSSTSAEDRTVIAEGSSVADVLDMLDFNADKNIVLRDGEELESSEIVEDGDHLTIMPRKLSSGC